jgi:hypothetical protein
VDQGVVLRGDGLEDKAEVGPGPESGINQSFFLLLLLVFVFVAVVC